MEMSQTLSQLMHNKPTKHFFIGDKAVEEDAAKHSFEMPTFDMPNGNLEAESEQTYAEMTVDMPNGNVEAEIEQTYAEQTFDMSDQDMEEMPTFDMPKWQLGG